jgi:hypothetical protein
LATGEKTVAIATFLLDAGRRRLHGLGIGNIGGDRQGPNAEAARRAGSIVQPLRIARQQRHVAPGARERIRRRPADPGTGACDYYNLAHHRAPRHAGPTQLPRRRSGRQYFPMPRINSMMRRSPDQ